MSHPFLLNEFMMNYSWRKNAPFYFRINTIQYSIILLTLFYFYFYFILFFIILVKRVLFG